MASDVAIYYIYNIIKINCYWLISKNVTENISKTILEHWLDIIQYYSLANLK